MTTENQTVDNESEHPAHAQTDLNPIERRDRIDTMDILRGFALIGIALMNVEWFNRTITELGRFDFSLTGADWGAGWFIRLFVEGKFYKLFSVLFGMGFAVMLIRAQEAGRPFYAWFTRRMVFLFLFGMAHLVLLWSGDILHDYAVGGLLVLVWVWAVNTFKWMAFLNQSRWYLRIGLGMLAMPFVVAMFVGSYFGSTRTQDAMLHDNQQAMAYIQRADEIKADKALSSQLIADHEVLKASGEEEPHVDKDDVSEKEYVEYQAKRKFLRQYEREQDKQAEVAAFTQPDWWKATVYRAGESVHELSNTPFFALIFCFPMFLVGYWFIASGVMRKPQSHKGLFKSMMWIGLGVGLMMDLAALLMKVNPVSKIAVEVDMVSNSLFFVGQYFMTAGYIGAFTLMCMTVRGKNWLSWLAPMGRMALTNYITHSIVLSSIFYGYAGGMFGQIPRAQQVGIVAAIILVQAIVSRIWLKHFKFGPLEWLWRSLTYLKLQPMMVEKQSLGTTEKAATA